MLHYRRPRIRRRCNAPPWRQSRGWREHGLRRDLRRCRRGDARGAEVSNQMRNASSDDWQCGATMGRCARGPQTLRGEQSMKLTDEQERKFGKAIMDSARCMGVYTPSEYAAMGRKAEELTREMHYREALAEPSTAEVERFLPQLRICGH